MKKNIGGIDRILRIGVGLLLIYLGLINNQIITDELARVVLIVFGSLSVFVASIAFCPLYKLIDFSTISDKKAPD